MYADHLEPSELFLFTPIIKGSDKDHYDHSEQNGQALDPVRTVLLALVKV